MDFTKLFDSFICDFEKLVQPPLSYGLTGIFFYLAAKLFSIHRQIKTSNNTSQDKPTKPTQQ
uniref:hypothetical protein n=1 Tax=Candidatus Scatocola faecigallinarum TaxID=2840916 RepID=UPI004025FD66